MTTDRTTKLLLALIALALFLNALVPLVQSPTVEAQFAPPGLPGQAGARMRDQVLVAIHDELERISNGTCRNGNIC